VRLQSIRLNCLWICTASIFLMGCPRDDGFEKHLDEAIELYEVRQELYADMTGHESDQLFNLLITTEKAIKPVARYIDSRATPFINDGIRIVVDDFVSLDSAGEIDDPVEPVLDIPEDLKDEMRDLILSFYLLEMDDFPGVATHCYEGLLKVSELETLYQVHLAMLRHVIESIGLGALHSIDYAAVSGGETAALSQEFVSIQILGLNELIVIFDCLANEIHQQGVGVLVNDLPHIPFIAEYEASDLF